MPGGCGDFGSHEYPHRRIRTILFTDYDCICHIRVRNVAMSRVLPYVIGATHALYQPSPNHPQRHRSGVAYALMQSWSVVNMAHYCEGRPGLDERLEQSVYVSGTVSGCR